MPWNRQTLKRVSEQAHTLDRNRLLTLVRMMVDEIEDGLDAIDAYTQAYSVLRDVVAEHDNYRAIPELFGRAASMARDYPDAAWMLGSKAERKMHMMLGRKGMLSDEAIRHLSNLIKEHDAEEKDQRSDPKRDGKARGRRRGGRVDPSSRMGP